MAATFLLLTALVQLAAAMTARSAADAAVAAATRRAALPGTDLVVETAKLTAAIAAIVPGAENVTVSLEASGQAARGRVRFHWVPPGPVFAPFVIVVDAEVPIAVAP